MAALVLLDLSAGFDVIDHTIKGWLSSGKKGISSLPWEEKEETPFFPEQMKKLGRN